MNIGELIKQLEKYDPKTRVVVTTESESLLKKGDLIRVFEIIDTHKTKGEFSRLDDGRPSLKYTRSKNSTALIEIEIAEE